MTILQLCILKTRSVSVLFFGKCRMERPASVLETDSCSVQLLQELRQATAVEWPKAVQMLVSARQAQTLAWLVGMVQAKRAIEIGTFTGYSAIAIARVRPVPHDGHEWLPNVSSMICRPSHSMHNGIIWMFRLQDASSVLQVMHLLDRLLLRPKSETGLGSGSAR